MKTVSLLKFYENFRRFRSENSGAVSVEWVVLTAAVAGLGLAAVSVIFDGNEGVAEASNTKLESAMETAAETG